jgi:hypothetical protein
MGDPLAKEFPACRTVRLEGLDSSISCCRAWRSSLAEITGNRSTRRQLRIRNACSLRGALVSRAPTGIRRQTQKAGMASVNQSRLSRSSIFLPVSLRLYQRTPRAVPRRLQPKLLRISVYRQSQALRLKLLWARRASSGETLLEAFTRIVKSFQKSKYE